MLLARFLPGPGDGGACRGGACPGAPCRFGSWPGLPSLLPLLLDVLHDLFRERVPLLGPQVEQFAFQVAQVAPGLGAAHVRDPGLEIPFAPQVRGVPLQGRQVGRVHYQAHLAGRIYRLVEADPVTRNAVSGRRTTSWH